MIKNPEIAITNFADLTLKMAENIKIASTAAKPHENFGLQNLKKTGHPNLPLVSNCDSPIRVL